MDSVGVKNLRFLHFSPSFSDGIYIHKPRNHLTTNIFRVHEMSEERIKERLRRLLELIDGEAHKPNTTITNGSYVEMLNELLAAHNEASKENTVKKIMFPSKVLGNDLSFTSAHLCDIDSFVDSVQHIMRIEGDIERYKADKLKWDNNNADFTIIQEYEEDAVLSFVIDSQINSFDLDSFEIKSLKLIGIHIENDEQFLEKQFIKLEKWYNMVLRLEYIGLENSWSLVKKNWSEFKNMYKFIQDTFNSMEYIRTYKRFEELDLISNSNVD